MTYSKMNRMSPYLTVKNSFLKKVVHQQISQLSIFAKCFTDVAKETATIDNNKMSAYMKGYTIIIP